MNLLKSLIHTLNVIRYKIFGGKRSPVISSALCWKCKKYKGWPDIYNCECNSCPFSRFTF